MQQYFFINSHLYNAKDLKMYNMSKLIVTVKCLIRAKGVHTSLMLQPLIYICGNLVMLAF